MRHFDVNKIRHLLMDKGISQRILASKLCMCESTLHNKLTGKAQFKVNEVIVLLDELDLSFNDLIVK